MKYPVRQQILEILNAGIQAPSADNRHHVWFAPRRDGVSIGADQHLLRSNERHRTVLTLLSLGAIVENIIIQASAFGFGGSVRFLDDWRSSGLLADVTWRPSDGSVDPLAAAIGSRHTNRRFFRGPPVEPDTQQSLVAEVANVVGAQLIWLVGSKRKAALRLIMTAETARFGTRALHDELFGAIRWDVGWENSCDEGLPPGSLEVEPFLRSAFSMLRSWSIMRHLKSAGIHRLLGMRAGYLPCRFRSHIGVICMPGEPELRAPFAGRAFQRLWLQATKLGLALQPMAGAVVLPWGPESALASALRSGWERVTPGITPLMLFRVGRASPPSVITSRKPLGAYLRGLSID